MAIFAAANKPTVASLVAYMKKQPLCRKRCGNARKQRLAKYDIAREEKHLVAKKRNLACAEAVNSISG
jgi:hypothetical protein